MWRCVFNAVVAAFMVACCSTARADEALEGQLRAAIDAYAAAFQSGDAAAVAACWTESGVHANREAGTRIAGRAAIEAGLQQLFADQPGARLLIELNSARAVTADVAAIEGQATVVYPDGTPSAMLFSAILVRQDGKWKLDQVDESPLPVPPTARDALEELAWLVGSWRDDNQQVSVETNVRWGAGESFLVRSYQVELPDGTVHQGTQVIGWDPILKQIRSWSFESDGAFGEGLWSRSGSEWLVRLTQTLADGRSASGTQVIRREDDNNLTVGMIAREIDGEPVPTPDAVRVVRVMETAAAAPPAVTGAEEQK